MERPSLPPAPPGRSALTCFLTWEERLRAQADDAAATASSRVGKAGEEAARIRQEGEERLKKLVLDAEEQAMREVERQARDRVSEVRVRTQRWVEQAEEAARDTLDDALDLLLSE